AVVLGWDNGLWLHAAFVSCSAASSLPAPASVIALTLDNVERPTCSDTQSRTSSTLTADSAACSNSPVNSVVSTGKASTLAPTSAYGACSPNHLYFPNRDSMTSLVPSHDSPGGTWAPSVRKYQSTRARKFRKQGSPRRSAPSPRQTRRAVCRLSP